MMPVENFQPDQTNPEVLEVSCGACLRPILVDSEYVEIFVEKFYQEMDEWIALHRMCYERTIAVLLDSLDTRQGGPL